MIDLADVERRRVQVFNLVSASMDTMNLNLFKFSIDECIVGRGSKVLWSKEGYSNNNQTIVTKHFIELFLLLKTCPRRFRTNCRSENVLLPPINVT